MNGSKIVALLAFLLATLADVSPARAAGTWTALKNSAPVGIETMLLLPDGTVMGLYYQAANDWYKLTPDSHGSYVNGTWSPMSSMIHGRLYFGSTILANGQVFVAGGEYVDSSHGETYDPIRNLWTAAPGAINGLADGAVETLPNGNVLLAAPYSGAAGTPIFNVASNTWTTGIQSPGTDEACFVKLPDGSILCPGSTTSSRFIPALNQWVADGNIPVPLFSGGETGSAYLLPNGNIFAIGYANTAIYTPSGNSSPGTWVAGPPIPNGLNCGDSPAAMMVNGTILLVADTGYTSGASSVFEYDYTTNAFTQVATPFGNPGPAFICSMLDLPDGGILFSYLQGQLWEYTPSGSPLAVGQPAISSVVQNTDGTFTLTGTLLNGITEGAAFGDDLTCATNYPIVRLTGTDGSVYYARTFNWSSTGVDSGTNPSPATKTTQFALPLGLPPGTYSLVVTANGNPSNPVSLTIPGGTDTAPTVATAASAVQSTTAPSTATLSVLGASANGESTLTYTWTVTGPGWTLLPSLSVNGSNAAKNCTATFDQAGTYHFTVTITDALGLSTTSTTSITVTQVLTSIQVTPAVANLTSGQTQQFTGHGYDQFGSNMSVQPTFTWALTSGGGTLSASGLYTSPGSGTAASLTATTGTLQASAGVYVVSAPWVSADVGSVNATGSAYDSAGVFTVNSQTGDIQGTADTLHYVYRSMCGDGMMIARVATQQNTAGWAKAGIMIRNSTAAGDQNAFMALSATNGVTFQNRATSGGSTTVSNASGPVAPYWVKLVRSGNNFTGYYSSNGTTWTQGGSATIAMGAAVLVGLAADSDNTGQMNTTTFDNVSMLLAQNDSLALNAGASGTLNLVGNDVVGPAGATSTISAITSASYGTVVNNGDGTVTYTANEGYAHSDSFAYTVSDGLGDTATAIVNVTVSGLVAYLKFDEGSGSTAVDFTGNGNTGTLNGGVTWTTGANGSPALQFDGTSGYVSMGNAPMLNITGQITISAWVQIQATGGLRDIVAHGYSTSPNGEVILRLNGNSYQFGSWNGSSYNVNATIPSGDIGTWVHLTGVYDGTTWRLYRNGALLASQAATVGAVSVNGNWDVGSSGVSTDLRLFKGSIDDVHIYNTGLSASAVAVLYNSVAPTVASPATAASNPVNGPRTNLSVLGASPNGEGTLFYTWTATGIPSGANPPTFSVNGTNAAKNTAVDFSAPGTYTLQVLIADTNGYSTSSSVTVTASQVQLAWTGGGSNTNWSNSANWAGGWVPNPGDQLVLSGSSNNDLPAGATYSSITLQGSNIALTGNALALNPGSNVAITSSGANNSISMPIQLNSNAAVTVSSGSLAVSGALSGSGSLSMTGPGTLTLSGANTYTGGTTINSGTLQIGGAGSLGNGSYAGAITDNGTFQYSSSANETLSGAISGTGGLVKDSGAGTLYLTANNSYAGGTTISAGTLSLGNNTPTGSVVGPITDNGTLQIYHSTAYIFSNNVSGSGTLNAVQSGSNTLSIDGGSTIAQSRLNIGGSGLTFANTTVTFSNSAWFEAGNASLYITPGASVTVNGNFYLTQPDGNNLGSTYITGGSLTVTGNMQDARDSQYHVYQSGGVVTAGQLLANQAYPGAGNSGGTSYTQWYDLTGGQLVVGNISGGNSTAWSRGIGLNLGGGTLTASASFIMNADNVNLTGTNGNVTIDTGSFTLGSGYAWSGAGGYIKIGTGTLNVPAASYSGSTTLNNGIANFMGGYTGGGALTVNTGATANIQGASSTFGTLSNSGGTTNIGVPTNSGAITVNGGVLNVNRALTAGSTTTVSSGTLNVNTTLSTTALNIGNGTVHLANWAVFDPGSIAGMEVHLDASGMSAGAISTWTNNSNAGTVGNFSGSGTVQSGGSTYNNKNVVYFNGSQTLSSSFNFGNNVTVMYVGGMQGTQNARLVGGVSNNWLLGFWSGYQDRAYLGSSWLYQGGTSADTSGHLYEGAINASGGAVFYRNGAPLASGTGFSGPNGLQLGGGYTNGTERSKGYVGELLVFNLVLSDANRAAIECYLNYKWFGAAPASIPSNIPVSMTASGGLLDLNGMSQTIASINSVSGATVALGGGVLTSGGDNTNTTFAGVISDSGGTSAATGGSLTKTGTGTCTLSGINTYSGATTIAGGMLSVIGSIPNSTVTDSGGTIAGTGTIGALTVGSGAVLAPGNGGIGTLSFNNKAVSLAGTAAMDINKSAGTSDLANGIAALTYGGTLNVTNLAGTLAAGDVFTLFTATSYSGSFATINLPALSPGLYWVTSNLATNGSVNVVGQTLTSIVVTPTAAGVSSHGTQQFSATAYDQYNNPMLNQPAFGWSNTGVGVVDSSGFYTASYASGTATVVASSGGVSGTASVTVINAVPTVATAASASPSTVTGTTTNLSVLGADSDGGGEPNLTYTWSATTIPSGASAPTYSANGTNAAKNTTATVSAAGAYTFTVTITDAGGLSVTSSVNVAVSQTLTTISVTPLSGDIASHATQQFTATANDQFGTALSTQPSFTWSSGGSGSVSSSGLYTASYAAGAATVTASSGGVSGTASIAVTNAAPTVTTTAAASPATVTGTTTSLSVLGADSDSGGEANLVYTWAATGTPAGAANPTFSANGTNASKNTTATFSAAGAYTLTVTVADMGGLGVTSNVAVTVVQTAASVIVEPGTASISGGQTQQLTAFANDQFGVPMAAQPTFTWAVSSGAGAVNSSGLYTAPTTATTDTVTATAGSIQGSAVVSVIPGLRGYWKLDEGTGTTAADSSGNGNAGTLQGGVTWTTGPNGSPALQFDGTSGYVSIGNPSILNITGQITVSAWIQIQATGGNRNIVEHGYSTSPNGEVFLRLNGSNYQFGTWNGSTYYVSTAIPSGDVGSWVHLAGVYDGTAWRLYRNGVLLASQTASVGALAVNANWEIGASAVSSDRRFFKGGIDDVHIYNTGLTAAQVADLAVRPGPTVVSAAAATPNPVTGTTANLSVLGTENGWTNSLTYTWGTTSQPAGATTPVFSVNGTNAAQNTTVTFGTAGAYTFTVTIADPYGLSTSSAVNVTVGSSLPAGWGSSDVGSVGISGWSSSSGSTFTVNGAGGGIGGTADAFQFSTQTLLGDGEIRAQVTSQANTGANAMAGVMIRNDSTAGSVNALVALTPGNGFIFQTRSSAGGSTVQGGTASSNAAPNNWVRLTRSGTLMTAYVSVDGTSWTQIGAATVTMNSSVSVGLVVTSANSAALGTATFSNVSVTPLPAPWQSLDLGATGLQGSAEYFNGAYTLKGAGTLSGTSDNFHFLYQTLSGDGQILARISTLQNTGTSADIGVMIRDGLTGGSMYAYMGTDGTGAFNWQSRSATGGNTTQVAGGTGTAPNLWVKVTRSGNTLSGYQSTDGTNWTLVSSQTISMGTNIYLGFVNASGSTSTLNTSVFDNVSVVP